jgi:uncharacterized protein
LAFNVHLNRWIDPESSLAETLCLACGLCCNGVLFADVRLQAEDNAARFRSLGLPITTPRSVRGPARFKQPCEALEGCRCRLYAERPAYCRQFECVLFKSVKAGRTQPNAALKLIRVARERADKVRRLLRELGDADERAPLSVRFRRTARRMERAELDDATVESYARLTLAVHDLNLLLREVFYP